MAYAAKRKRQGNSAWPLVLVLLLVLVLGKDCGGAEGDDEEEDEDDPALADWSPGATGA